METQMKTTIAALTTLVFLLGATFAHAQSGTLGSASSPVVNAFGRAMGGVNVAVCGHPASGGYPCSNLSTVYTDITFATVLSAGNPTTTDARGNWGFYVLPGQYDVEFYGTGMTSTIITVSAPCVPTSSTSCAGPLVTSTLALKPQATDAVQYVSPNGNDSNDGLSIGTAKLTILGAYNSLSSTGGTIYVSGGVSGTSPVQCTPTGGQGLGIAGSLDPNYNSMPEVLNNIQWVKAKSGTVAIIGISATFQPAASKVGYATPVSCGNSSTKALVLSSVTDFTSLHIAWRGSSGIQIGYDSNGSQTDTNAASNDIIFQYNNVRTDCGTSCGPPLAIAGSIWDEIDNNLFENNGINNGISASSNLASNIYISNGGSAAPMGLIYLRNNDFTGGGGVRFDANSSVSASLYMSGTEMEGTGTCQPVLEVINSGSYSAVYDVQGGFSDCGISPPAVRVASGNDPCNLSVRGINQSGQTPILEGPLTVGDTPCQPGSNPSQGVSAADNGPSFSGVIPAAKNQRNGMYGLQLPQVDEYRRSFAPSFVRFANLAPQNPATWTANPTGQTGSSLVQFQGPGDPAGITNAATLSCTGNGGQGGCDYYVYNNNLTFNAGDYLYVGVWAQPASTAGFASGTGVFASPITLEQVNNGSTLRIVAGGPINQTASVGGIVAGPFRQTDGNWQWIWALAKVTQPSGSVAQIKIHLAFQAGFPTNFYAPMFLQVPASSLACGFRPRFRAHPNPGIRLQSLQLLHTSLSAGMPINVSQCSIAGYNGEFVISAVTSTTFSFYDSASGLGSPTGCVISPEQ